MTSLVEKDFIVVEDGVEQLIQAFSSVDTPYNILLLFDRSLKAVPNSDWSSQSIHLCHLKRSGS